MMTLKPMTKIPFLKFRVLFCRNCTKMAVKFDGLVDFTYFCIGLSGFKTTPQNCLNYDCRVYNKEFLFSKIRTNYQFYSSRK